MKCKFAQEWTPEKLAFGFLSGALKREWVGPGERAQACVANLHGSLARLRQRFGYSGYTEMCSPTLFGCIFLDVNEVPEF